MTGSPHKRLSIGLLLSLLFISGCVATTQNISLTPTVSEKRKIPPNQGILVARLANASSSNLPLNYLTVTPKDFNQGTEVKMQRLTALGLDDKKMNNLGAAGAILLGSFPSGGWDFYSDFSFTTLRKILKTTTFSANLPPGDYTIDQLGTLVTTSTPAFRYSFSHDVDIKIGTFSVEPGKITDLGTIVLYPKPDEDKYINTVLRSQYKTDTIHQLANVLENQIDLSDDDNILSWHEDELDSEREAEYISVLNNPVTYNRRYLADDGTMYFIGKLGSVISRSRDGQWNFDTLDTDLDLLMISKSPAGDLAVVAERGNLFYKKKGKQWEKFSIRNDKTVKDIYLHDNGIIDTLILDKHVIIFRADFSQPTSESGQLKWVKMAWYHLLAGWGNINGMEYKPKKLARNKDRIKQSRLLQIKDDNYIVIDNLLFKYNPSDWQIKSVSRSRAGKDYINAGNEITAVRNSDNYFRYDTDKEKWKKLSNIVTGCTTSTNKSCSQTNNDSVKKSDFRIYVAPAFQEKGTAYALAYNRRNTKQRAFLTRSTDSGQSWDIIEDPLPKKYCHDLIREIKDRLILSCKGQTLDFFESSDGGQSWQHVREHEVF